MYAMGLLSDEAVESGFAGPTLGMELSGVVCQVGTAVARVRPGTTSSLFAPASFASKKTSSGAVVPEKSRLVVRRRQNDSVFYGWTTPRPIKNEGERVLIHGAAGGVGIANSACNCWVQRYFACGF